MKTENRIKFTTLLQDIEVETHPLAPIVGIVEEKAQKQGKCIHTEDKIYFFCPKCKSDKFRKAGTIKGSNRQRYRCEKCDKSFSLSTKVIDVELLFELYYDEQHQDQEYMLSTRYRKERESKTDSRYKTFFDGRLKQLDFEGKHDVDELIKIAFRDTNVYMDNLEQRVLAGQQDSFSFFLNHEYSDEGYYTKHEHYMLVRKHDIDNYAQQNHLYPLFFCECGSVDLRRHGSNNNGRRRLKCQICKKIFLIGLQNIMHKSYFETMFKELFTKIVPKFPLLEELIEQMYDDLYHTKFYTYFENLVYNLDLITYRTKLYIVMLFVNMQYYRYAIHTFYPKRRIARDSFREGMKNFEQSGDVGFMKRIPDLFEERTDDMDLATEMKVFSSIDNLDFLKSDSENIDSVLSSSEMYESNVPWLFDNEYLVKEAVKDTIEMSQSIADLKKNKITNQS